MTTVAVWVDVRVPLTVLRVITSTIFVWGRVMLDNKIIPIRDPQIPVGPHFRRNRREPLVGRSKKGKAVFSFVTRAVAGEVIFPQQMPGRTANKRHLFTERLRESRRGRHGLTRTGGIVVESVHLTNVGCNRMERTICRNHLGAHPLFATSIGGSWNAAEEAGIVVSGRAKHVTGRIETHPPGVVVELVHELQLRSVRLHAEHTRAEALLFAADRAVKR